MLMFEQTIGFSMPELVEHVEQRRQVHRDEPGLGVVAAAHVVGEDPERLVEAEAEEQVDDDVLQEDDRGRSPSNIFISASISSVVMPSMSFLAIEAPPRIAASRSPSSGRKRLTRAEHAVLGHRVRVLVRVRHARVEREVRVAVGVGAHVVADRGDAVVRRAHEGADALVVRGVQDVDDGLDRLEAHRLGARLLLRHVVDAEELVVAEQQAVHQAAFRVSSRLAGSGRRRSASRGEAEARGASGASAVACGARVEAPLRGVGDHHRDHAVGRRCARRSR